MGSAVAGAAAGGVVVVVDGAELGKDFAGEARASRGWATCVINEYIFMLERMERQKRERKKKKSERKI